MHWSLHNGTGKHDPAVMHMPFRTFEKTNENKNTMQAVENATRQKKKNHLRKHPQNARKTTSLRQFTAISEYIMTHCI
jgi:hypothetical protein